MLIKQMPVDNGGTGSMEQIAPLATPSQIFLPHHNIDEDEGGAKSEKDEMRARIAWII